MRSTCWVSLILLGLGSVNVYAGQITVVFRFDDYSARSNTAFETRLIEAFKRSDVCCTFSVVPYVWGGYGRNPRPQDVIPLTVEKAAILKDAMDQGIVDVAMHSYSHQMTGPWTEFAGLAYDEQLGRIRKGRDLLSALLGTRVTTFVPAWNSYDGATLRALGEAGFQCLSAARDGPHGLQASCPLKFLPSVCDLDELREAIASARRTRDSCPIIVVLFHAYDFIEAHVAVSRWSFQEFEELLDWTVSQEDVVVKSVGQLLEAGADLSARRLEDNRVLVTQVPGYVPPFLGRLLGVCAPPVYLSSDTIRQQQDVRRNVRMQVHICAALLYLVAGSAAATTALGLKTIASARFGHAAVAVFRYAGGMLVLAALAASVHDRVFGYKCALLVSASLGTCVGAFWGAFRNRRAEPASIISIAPRVSRLDTPIACRLPGWSTTADSRPSRERPPDRSANAPSPEVAGARSTKGLQATRVPLRAG